MYIKHTPSANGLVRLPVVSTAPRGNWLNGLLNGCTNLGETRINTSFLENKSQEIKQPKHESSQFSSHFICPLVEMIILHRGLFGDSQLKIMLRKDLN